MKKYSLLMLLCLLTLAAYSQKKETRSLSNFKYLSVGQSIDVTLVKGSKESVTVEISGADLEDVKTDVSGGKLKIQMGKGSFRNVNVSATVTYTELEGISVSSSASVTSKGTIKSSEFELKVSSSGDSELELDVNEFTAKISSSGKAKLSGNANDINISVSSSGKLYAYDLSSRNAMVRANSSGKAEVSASNKLDAKANSSGKVRFKGSPEEIYIDTNSSGRVTKA